MGIKTILIKTEEYPMKTVWRLISVLLVLTLWLPIAPVSTVRAHEGTPGVGGTFGAAAAARFSIANSTGSWRGRAHSDGHSRLQESKEVSYIYLPVILNTPYSPYFDDFSDPDSGWFTGSGSGWSAGYLDSEYQIALSANDTYAWGSPEHTLPNNYRLEVDAHMLTTNAGAQGIIFAADLNAETAYMFLLFPQDQAYALVRQNPNFTQTLLEDDDYNPVINTGTTVNHIRVDRIGASIHISVNNVLVLVWDDDTFSGKGLYFGLAATSAQDGPVDARFDNFSACSAHRSNPLFVEDFSISGRWMEADYGWGNFSYQSGEYEILIRNTNSWGFANAPIEGGLPRYAIDVDARITAGEEAMYGINFGQIDDDNFYQFRIYPAEQQYKLFKLTNGIWSDLTAWTVDPAIIDETGANHLRVERDGALIRLYANGTLLTSLSDSAYLSDQELSLFGMSGTEAPIAVRFDNLSYSELP